MLPAALLKAAERSIAAALARDSVTARRLGALQGKCVLISARDPEWQLWLLPAEGEIALRTASELPADCELHAPSSLLARLLISSDRKALLQEPDVELVGDGLIDLRLRWRGDNVVRRGAARAGHCRPGGHRLLVVGRSKDVESLHVERSYPCRVSVR